MTISIHHLIQQGQKYLNTNEINQIKIAYEFAKNAHDGQLRKSKEPFINHPLNVSSILIELEQSVETIIAGLLHDTIEDTSTSK